MHQQTERQVVTRIKMTKVIQLSWYFGAVTLFKLPFLLFALLQRTCRRTQISKTGSLKDKNT